MVLLSLQDKIDKHYLEQDLQDALANTPKEAPSNSIPSLNALLLERLALLSDNVTEFFDAETQSSGSPTKDRLNLLGGRLWSYARYCTLVCHVISLLMQNNVIGPTELRNLDAVKKTGV